MKFTGNGVVWDAENDKPLAEFIDGVFETKVKKTIKTLNGLGFTGDEEIEEPVETPEETPLEEETPVEEPTV